MRPRHPGEAVAFATDSAHAQLTADDERLAAALRGLGVRVDPAVWSDATVRWGDYDLVLVRSCWDYHLRLGEFLMWLAALETSGVTLRNPPALVRWNAHKRYLDELGADGIRVVPGAWVRVGGLARALARCGWDDAVVKPAVGASAYGIFRTSPRSAGEGERRIRDLVASGTVSNEFLVQPYVPEIVSDGEWSLVFLPDGGRLRFSHGVCKRPAPEDFRVQLELGGTAVAATPAAGLVADAWAALERACARCAVPAAEVLYARVDGFARRGRLVITELECIEPELFLAHDPDAAARLAGATVQRYGSHLRPSA
jgi:glutathione synthase/RimK-type ligase-like ATP-grasp enzyme